MSRSLQAVALAVTGLCMATLPAAAEPQLSAFGGANWNLSSDAKLSNAPSGGGVISDDRSIDWDGASGEMPPYWGVRGTYWLNPGSSWGFALDYVHMKAIADIDFANDPTYGHLEFTDGDNLLIFNAMYRFNPLMRGTLVPYVGAGIGVSIPHVEVSVKGGNKTFEYQLTGVAAQVLAGLEYKLNEKWSLFTEARFSYSHIDADLNGGGSFETDLWSPQLAVGISYRF
ncbi:MAG TPA: outer membrane beta-barrel protein [Hyphomicrobiaceae bacterium]|nr:outer membrane beta-barrel protein [Hyphomicrobiaceae bacterium]